MISLAFACGSTVWVHLPGHSCFIHIIDVHELIVLRSFAKAFKLLDCDCPIGNRVLVDAEMILDLVPSSVACQSTN